MDLRYGVAQGRFQIIHHGHMEYLLEAKKRSDFLIVGISDHDPERSYFDPKTFLIPGQLGPVRVLGEPHHTFTYFERVLMVSEALRGAGVAASDFAVVPFPVHRPHLIPYYVPTGATIFVTIYGEWGREKIKLFEALGYPTEILWERSMAERLTTGTEVRRRLAAGEDWETLVPQGVAGVIKKLGLDKIVRDLGTANL